jgi:uncharacterized membrane protein YphA (DoxX/SURF4 family)
MWDDRVESTWKTLRAVFVAVPIAAGVDKFLHLLADWEVYLSPLARDLVPMSPLAFMRVVGIVEIAAGVLVLFAPRVGAYVVAAWLASIAVNLVTIGGFLDVAVRDVVMAISAFCLARLSEARARVRSPERRTAPTGASPARA